jgi:hypothetical protein
MQNVDLVTAIGVLSTEIAQGRTMFLGRDNELKKLEDLFVRPGASLAICRGRRRIGKSTLIHQFGANSTRYLRFQGLAPREGMEEKDQLDSFGDQLFRQTGLPKVAIESWPQAFSLLAYQIGSEKTIVLLDEISWMAMREPDFAGYLKNAWDLEFKSKPRLVMVLCGSVSSWIEENILNNTGFVGRVSLTITLDELPLPVCNEFWKKNKDHIAAGEKLKILAVTGGVPRYLEEIRPSLSAEENIRRLCFTKEGLLFSEFDQIFHDIFSKRADTYRDIAGALVSGSKPLHEIGRQIGWKRGGHLTEYLHDLELSGFIARDMVYSPKTARASRIARYRLSDNYVRFYLKYVFPHAANIRKGIYETVALDEIIAWDIILGLQFENLVLNNVTILLPILGIQPSVVLSISPYFQRAKIRTRACQIDLLIHTRHSLYVCEMKTGARIGREVIDEVREKVTRLERPRGLSVRTVLMYEGELDPAVARQGYFDKIVSFGDLLVA